MLSQEIPKGVYTFVMPLDWKSSFLFFALTKNFCQDLIFAYRSRTKDRVESPGFVPGDPTDATEGGQSYRGAAGFRLPLSDSPGSRVARVTGPSLPGGSGSS